MNARSVLKGVAAGIFAVAGASAVRAGTDYYWTGAGADDHWTTVANWTVAGLPAESYPGADGTAFFTNAMNVVRLDSNLTVEDEATQRNGHTKIYNDDPSTTNTLKFTGLWMLQNSTNCTFEANGNVVIETVGAPGYVKGKTLASDGARITMDVALFDDNANQSFVATGAGSKLTVNGACFHDEEGKNTGVSFESHDGAEVIFKPYKVGTKYRNPLDLITLKAIDANLYANDGNTKFTAAVDVTCDHGYMDLTCLQPAKAGSTITLSNGGMLRLRGATKLPAAEAATTTLTLGDTSVLEEYDSSITLGKGLTVKLAPTVASSETDGRIVTRADKGGAITLNSGVKFEIDCSAFKDFVGSKTMAVIKQKRSGSAATYSLPAEEDVTLTGEGAERCTYKFTTENKTLLLTIEAKGGESVAEIDGKGAFLNLQAAIDAVGAEETIKLIGDATYTQTVSAVGKSFTLDGDGHTLTWEMPTNTPCFNIFDESNVDIENVKIVTTGSSRAINYGRDADDEVSGALSNVTAVSDGVALMVGGDYSWVEVYDCSFTHEGKYKEDAADWNLSVLGTWAGGGLEIHSGTFTSDCHCVYQMSTGGYIGILDGVFTAAADKGVICVSGGDSQEGFESHVYVYPTANSDDMPTFNGNLIVSDNPNAFLELCGGNYDHDPSAYIPGEDWYAVKGEDERWTILEKQIWAVGDETFPTLNKALSGPNTHDGAVIKLLVDLEVTNTIVASVSKNRNVTFTLDGDGHTVTGVSSNPDVELFKIVSGDRYGTLNLNVTNLTVKSTGYCQAFFFDCKNATNNDVRATFCDVTVESDGSALTTSGSRLTVDVADCDFTHAGMYKEGANEWLLTTMAAWNGSTINVNSGSYKSDAAALYVLPTSGEINVLGGTIEAETHAFAAYYDGVSPTHVVVPEESTALVKGDFYVVCSSGSDEPFVLMGGTYDREPPETVASKFKPIADGYLAEKIGDDPELWQVRAIIPVTEVEIGGAPEAALSVGGSVTLTVTVGPDNADIKTVAWTSSDEEVATVDADGVVTALAEGEVEITATADYGEAFDTVKITVGAGSAYPTYVGDDVEKQGKYVEWAKKYGDDKDSAYEKAFLLNVAPADADEAEKEFKITSITVDGDTVTVEVAEGPEGGYNGKVEIQGSETPNGPWAPKADDQGQRFFKAILK